MFKKMKLSVKLAFGFGLILTALVIVGSTGFFKIAGVQTMVTDLSETHVPLLHVVSEIDVTATKQELVVTQYALHKNEELRSEFYEIDKTADMKFQEIKALVSADQELVDKGWLDPIEKMETQYDMFVTACRKLIEAVQANQPIEVWGPIADKVAEQSEALMVHIDGFLNINDKESTAVATLVSMAATSARMIIGSVGSIAIITGILLAFFLIRSITRPITRVIEGLDQGAEQVASASGQVSSSSQQLAEGSSEQASSIEETSSSLEEMSSMTKQNADNANQADSLMKEANNVVGQANDSMAELTHSMEEISKASEETSKIIKTIDEIAFQTNLLALNAAVEAARAGEAGAGFAVVADEVRNLAMRAADAAKTTAELIEGTVKKVHDGDELVAATNDAFTRVAASSAKVAELVGEIAAASREQAEGIEQINKAVAEMDKVVQQNAANAEETASASEEMNAQAEQLKEFIGELTAMVGHAGKASGTKGQSLFSGQQTKEGVVQTALPTAATKAKSNQLSVQRTGIVTPDQVIPLEDDDFKDF